MFPISSLILNLGFVLCSIVSYLVYHFRKTNSLWRNSGVPYLGPTADIAFELRKNKSLAIQDRYHKLAPHPYGGVYLATKPYLIIRDPQLIQTVLIKAFGHFYDRGLIMPEDVDPLSANIFNLSGARWRNVRLKLVHSFSSMKLKSIYMLLEECHNVLDRYLDRQLEESDELDVRDLMTRFTIDAIGRCAFGFDCETIFDAKSEFRRIGLKFSPNWVKMAYRETLASISPRIISWFNWKNMDPELEKFFQRVTEDTVKIRNENPIKHKDFMQLLINTQKEERERLAVQNDGSEPLFSDQIMAAHVFLFFVAGFESSSITLGYCLYELALNPQVMDKLHAEIEQVLSAHGGKLDYEVMKEMTFLECVINETLRKHPPLGSLDRVCTKDFVCPYSSFKIKENTNIIIPVYALHHDPQFYPEPQRFNPDRFNTENKSKIVPGTYLPFGAGPRICVGTRFALLEIKTALTHIVRNYTIHPTKRTPISITYKQPALFNISSQGLYLRFQKRSCS